MQISFQKLEFNKLWNLSAYTKKTPNSDFLLTDLHPAIVNDVKSLIDEETNDTRNSSSEIEKSICPMNDDISPSAHNKSPGKVNSPCTLIETDAMMDAGTATTPTNKSELSNDGFIIPDETDEEVMLIPPDLVYLAFSIPLVYYQ